MFVMYISYHARRLVCSLNAYIYTQERDGWYTTAHFERIKTVLRHKFFSLLEGHIASDEECAALLVVNPVSQRMPTSRSQRLRPGKHNMAKGAMRPEDAAMRRIPCSFRWVKCDLHKGSAAESCLGKKRKGFERRAEWLSQGSANI